MIFMSKLVNLFKRIALGVWRLFTLTRSVILNVIFVVFFIGFIAILGSDVEQVIVPNKSALVLNLVGDFGGGRERGGEQVGPRTLDVLCDDVQ